MPQSAQHQQVRPHRHPRSTSAQQSSLERHRRKCAVCHHPERESIEEEFLHWHNPVNIVHEFDLGDRRILYRHAHATGLYDQRRRNYLFTIENVLECGDDIEFTAAAYIKAVRAYACLCDTVRWTEPATRVQHDYHVHADASGHDAPPNSVPGTGGTSAVAGSQPVRSSSRLPDASQNSPVPSAPPHAEGVSPDGAHCGSGLQPRQKARLKGTSFRERLEGRGSASTSPRATCDSPVTNSESQDASHSLLPQPAVDAPVTTQKTRPVDRTQNPESKSKPVSSVAPTGSNEEFIANALSLIRASSSKSPASRISNRHNLELESPVTPTKQTAEAISNRHKIAK